eukprot:GHVR01094609.1.p1 GENE.GHVR01094609.1~~GHVR01094609.1.p1  ORF type:complete len:345 (+),score=125.59 GHVR01094609.1:76-1110(+)
MSAASHVLSRVIGAIPESLKDAAGLSRRLSSEVAHIVCLSFQQATWFGSTDTFLTIGYIDGYQIFKINITPNMYTNKEIIEIISIKDNPIHCIKVLNTPIYATLSQYNYNHNNIYAYNNISSSVSNGSRYSNNNNNKYNNNIQVHPLFVTVQMSNAKVLRFHSLSKSTIVHTVRLPFVITSVESIDEFFAVTMGERISIFSLNTLEVLYSVVSIDGTPPPLALSLQWIAYSSPPYAVNFIHFYGKNNHTHTHINTQNNTHTHTHTQNNTHTHLSPGGKSSAARPRCFSHSSGEDANFGRDTPSRHQNAHTRSHTHTHTHTHTEVHIRTATIHNIQILKILIIII